MRLPTLDLIDIPDAEHECADLLAGLRWPHGLVCTCGGDSHRRLAPRPRVFVCRKCRHHTSVTAGTLMHGCHVPMRYWLIAANFISGDSGVSATFLAEQLDVSYETAWQLLHRLRAAMGESTWPVQGEPTASTMGVACSRPYRNGGKPTGWRSAACVTAVVGESGTAVHHLPHVSQTATWIRESLGLEFPGHSFTGAALRVLRRIWGQLIYTHAGVSELWLQRYLGEACFRENNASTPQILGSAMAMTRSTFLALRPAFEPWGYQPGRDTTGMPLHRLSSRHVPRPIQ